MVTASTSVFGLMGHAIRRSLSPAMHNELFALKGVDAVYVAFDVLPSRAGQVADAIRTLDLAGCNLTVPFKAVILSQLDEVSPTASEARAVNVVTQRHGQLTGFNTDGDGFVAGFEERIEDTVVGAHVVIMGCGGAGRAIAATLANRGVASVTVLNRTVSAAESFVEHLAVLYADVSFRTLPLTREAFRQAVLGADLVINSTSAAGRPVIDSFDVSGLSKRTAWCDVNYWMDNAPHVDALASRGHVVQRGLSMLFHQGALSFEIFTGYPIDTATIRRLVG